MGEMSLYTGIEDVLWPRIAKRRSVLVQKIHQLFGDLSGNNEIVKKLITWLLAMIVQGKTFRQICQKYY